jgi:LPXTG-motif cell wall-anchored protein
VKFQRYLAAIAALGAGVFSFAIMTVRPAEATAPDTRVWIQSECHPGIWYVNPDEGGADPAQGDRRPTVGPDGFTFSGNQLMHTGINLPIDGLDAVGPGSYVADPAPSLHSFFSVEVANDPGAGDFSGYATLRWDTDQNKWNIGGTDLYDASAEQLVKDNNKGQVVFSFGVGYVNTPNDGTETTVTSVSFNSKVYNLVCAPATTTTSAAVTPVATSVATLPVTGTSVTTLVLIGLGALVTGILLVILRGKIQR